MQSQTLEQLYSFFAFILVGFLIGLLFDFFRISRKSFKTSNLLTNVEDITFWLITGALILFSIFKFNNGNLRIYTLVGILIGVVIYMVIFSKVVIKTLVKIILFLKRCFKTIFNIALYPLRIIFRIFKNILKPIKNLQITTKNNLKKLINLKKSKNKSSLKKDFA